MAFHLGKPILVMILCGIGAGTASRLTMRSDARADYEVWCFSDQNYKTMSGIGRPSGTESLKELASKSLGGSVDIQLIQARALATRLSGLFMANVRGPGVPDAVDIEAGTVARFFRPPADEIGFLPLNDLLEKHGWTGKLLETRMASWSKDGKVFGIPLDVHPTYLVYDHIAFEEAGVDLPSSRTWDDFIENGLKYQAYWASKGDARRRAFEMTEAQGSVLLMMMLQRGINVVDQHGVIHLTDEKTLDTLVKYVRMLVGPRAIGGGTAMGNDAFAQDLRVGYVSAFLCPDWRVKYLKDNAPGEFAGRMRLMKMPMWPDSPYQTTTWGGTAVAIPRNARDPEASFALIEKLYVSPESLKARASGSTYILPAVKSAWNNPRFDEPDAYFGGQTVRRMYADMAPAVPPRYISPASLVAEVEMAMVLLESLSYARSSPAPDDAALRQHCSQLLVDAQDRVKRQVAHGKVGE